MRLRKELTRTNYITPLQDSDFYPSFRRANCLDENCLEFCQFPCIRCFVNGQSHTVCTQCSYGYDLNGGNCYQCPSNCLDCNIQYGLWIADQRKICSESQKAYYFNKDTLSECSKDCLYCSSINICLKCKENYYFTMNELNQIVCLPCTMPNNCKTCVMYSYNEQKPLYDYEFETLNTFEKFQKKDYQPLCLTCLPNYVRKEDNKCYLCTLPGCKNCMYGNSEFYDINLKYSYIFSKNFVAANLQLICFDCGDLYIATIQSNVTECQKCSNFISNCDKCAYAHYSQIYYYGLQMFGSYYWRESLSLQNDNSEKIIVTCTACAVGYVFGNDLRTICKECPINCEFCFLNKNNLVCGRCKINYVLIYDTGECVEIDSAGISDNYKNECSKIVNKNPIKQWLLDSIEIICQECKDSKKFPSINGACLNKNDNCDIQYQENFIANITNYIYNYPQLLGEIVYNLDPFYQKKCMKCKTGSKINFNDCCDLSKHPIRKCLSCLSCSTISYNYDYCLACEKCESEEIDDDKALTAKYYTFLYAKRIYLNLKIYPLWRNDSYITLFKELDSFQYIELDSENLHTCYPCPILSINCKKPDNFQYNSIQNYYSKMEELLVYLLVPTQCKQGFVYDSILKRCIFCPNGWENCESFTEIEINFVINSNYKSKETDVTSFQELIEILNKIENNMEFNYISNEFAIRNLTYRIILPDGLEFLPNPDFSYSITTEIRNRIPSLKTVAIIFQPNTYYYDTTRKIEVVIAHRLSFLSYDNVIMRNIVFKVVPYIMDKANNFQTEEEFNKLLAFAPGFTFNHLNVQISNCEFIHFDTDKRFYNGKVYPGDLRKTIDSPYINEPLDLFVISTVNCDKNSLRLEKVFIDNLNIVTPQVDKQIFAVFSKHFSFFNLLAQNVFIEDLFIYKVTFKNIGVLNLGQVGNYDMKINNLVIFNSKFENIVVFGGFDFNSITLENLYIVFSFAFSTTYFNIDKSSTCKLKNIFLDTNKLISSSSNLLFSVRSFIINNIQLLNNMISSFFLITDIEGAQNNALDIEKLFVFYNVFSSRGDKLLISIVYPSSVPANFFSFFNFESSIIAKNNYINVQEEDIYLIVLKYLDKVTFFNISVFDNDGFSFFYFDSIKETEFNIMKYEKKQSFDNQTGHVLLQIFNFKKKIILNSFNITNIKSNINIISILNLIFNKGNSELLEILFQNFIMENIFSSSDVEFIVAPINLQIKNELKLTIEKLFVLDCYINDQSEMEGSSSVLYLSSLVSTIYLSKISIENITTNGRINGFSFFGTEIYILDSNFSISNDKGEEFFSIGGFFKADVEKLQLLNCKFLKSAADYGGAFYVKLKKSAYLVISFCTFSDLKTLKGGAFYINSEEASSKSAVIIESVTFNKCFAKKSGGIVYFEQNKVNINQIIFQNCDFNSFNSDTASILYSSYSTLILNNCNIIYRSDYSDYIPNLSSPTGSIIEILSSKTSINNSIFRNLQSGTAGPNLFDVRDKAFNISNCIFSDFYYSNLAFSLEGVHSFIFNTVFKNVSFSSSVTSIILPGFILARKSEIMFKNCLISEFSASGIYTFAGFIKLEGSNFTFIDSFVYNMLGYNEGCINGMDSVIRIRNSIFSTMISKRNGGVLSSINSKININASDFLYCRAGLIGGAIYAYLPNSNERSFVFNSKFINNSAQIAGAIYYQIRVLEIEKETVFFKDNSAEFYGQSIYSYPRAFKFLEDADYLKSSMSSFRSGDTIFNITIYLLDEVNEIIKSQIAFSPLYVTFTPFSSFKRNIAGLENKLDHIIFYSNEDFSYTIRDKKLYGVRGTKMNISFYQPDIRIPSNSSNELLLSSNLSFSINLRECLIGELDKMNETLDCKVCLPDYYSYMTSDLICKNCLEGLNCNETGMTYVKKGFWRDSIFSEFIISCDENLYDCIGGNNHSNALCSEGHVGAKCASCDLKGKYWRKKYARSSGSQCIDCSSVKYNYIILAIVSLWSFVSMFLSVKGTLAAVKSIVQSKVLKVVAMYSLIDKGECMSSIYIKIYLSYYQIIQVINTFDLTIPDWMKIAPETVGNSVTSAMYSFDCLIANIEFDFPEVYFKIFFTLLIPIFYLLVFGGGYFIYMKITKSKTHFSYFYTVCLFTLVTFQADIVQSLIEVLSCVKIGEKYYIKSDLNFLCYTEDFWLFTLVLALPGLFFWAFLCPGGILIFLMVNKSDLNKPKNIIRFGYLYQEYRIYFWEFVKMYEKISIVFFLEFYDQDVTIKGPLILLALTFYFMLLVKYEPYSSIYLNRLEKLTTAILYSSIILALLAYKNSYDYLLAIAYVSIGIINIVYNVVMIYFIAFSLFAENNEKIKKIILKITKILHLGNLFKIREVNLNAMEKWKNAKRLVSKYLREKVRRKSQKNGSIMKRGDSIYNLSLENYDPYSVGTKQDAQNSENSLILEEKVNLKPPLSNQIKQE